jgi:3-hydroxybutyryl-CoA dehydrogenase
MSLTASQLTQVSVLGAGTMGHGIAQLAAQAGLSVILYDVKPELAERGLQKLKEGLEKAVAKGKLTPEAHQKALAGLRASHALADVKGSQLVIEAAPESMALKQQLLKQVAEIVGPDAVLASNTSSLSLTELAAALPHPGRVIGMHFFNPPPVMKLLEVVHAQQTSPETLAFARAVGTSWGKDVIEVRDSPGFASSRLGICIAMEAIRMVEEGVASAADIDKAMELGYNHPMGPLKLTDLVGLDVRLTIAEYLHRELGSPQFHPPQLLKRMVRAGKLGKKTGEGFYKYDASPK